MSNNEIVIKVENLSLRGVGNLYEPEAKRYRLGLIGGKTLRDDIQRWWAKFPILNYFSAYPASGSKADIPSSVKRETFEPE